MDSDETYGDVANRILDTLPTILRHQERFAFVLLELLGVHWATRNEMETGGEG